MRAVDLSGLQGRYVVPATPRLARWASAVAFVAGAVAFVLHLSGDSPLLVTVVTGVLAVSFGVPLVLAPRAGERLTCLEPDRVGTATTSWRGVQVVDWYRWAQVERVAVPGRWEDAGVRLVLPDGVEVALPGLVREDGQRLAAAVMAAREDVAQPEPG